MDLGSDRYSHKDHSGNQCCRACCMLCTCYCIVMAGSIYATKKYHGDKPVGQSGPNTTTEPFINPSVPTGPAVMPGFMVVFLNNAEMHVPSPPATFLELT